MKQELLFTDPPSLQAVSKFFLERNAPDKEAETFYLFWEINWWTNKSGKRLVDWKAAARRWIREALVFQQEQLAAMDLTNIAQ